MGAGASVAAAGVKVKAAMPTRQKPETITADLIPDALCPPGGWLRVLRSDNIEGYIRSDQKRSVGKLPGYYAEKAVAWHLCLEDARSGKEPMGIIPKGSGLIGLEVTPIDPADPLKRQYTRFVAEISPRMEVAADWEDKIMKPDPASIIQALVAEDEQRPEEFRAVEVWVAVSQGAREMDRMRRGGMAVTVVEIASANKPWPVPCMLEPVPEPEPPVERSAEDLLNTGMVKFEDGQPAEALAEYQEAAKASQLNLYMLRTRKQLLLGNGTGAAFRKTPDMMDRSIHHAQELTLWRAVWEDEEWIRMENDLYLPRNQLVLVSTPLDQLVIRAMATAGWLAAALALDDFAEATVAYDLFKTPPPPKEGATKALSLNTFIQRRPVAQALAAYELERPKPQYGYDESWMHFRAIRDHGARHGEDLTLKTGELVAVAQSGQHETGWWEGFIPSGAYGLLPCHAVEPANDLAQSDMEGWRSVRYPNRVQFITPLADHDAATGRRPLVSEMVSPPDTPPSDETNLVRPGTGSKSSAAVVPLAPWSKSGKPLFDLATAVVRARKAEPLRRMARRRGGRQQVVHVATSMPYQTTHTPQSGQPSTDLSDWPPERMLMTVSTPGTGSPPGSPRAGDNDEPANLAEQALAMRYVDGSFPSDPTSLAGGWEDNGPAEGGRWLCNPPLAHETADRYKLITWARACLLRADTNKAERAVLNPLRNALPLMHPRNKLTGKGTALPSDVVAGEGDSAFLSVLVVLARRTPIRIERLIKSLGFGRYAVRFQDFGSHRTIDIDEFLPCLRQVAAGASSGEVLEGGALVPVFGQITSGVLWSALIEKAWAKYYRIGMSADASAPGSYHTVNGLISDPGDALVALTGAPVEFRSCEDGRKHHEVAEDLWKFMRAGHDAGYVVCAGTGGSRTTDADELKLLGLEPLKAYAVAASVEVRIGPENTQRLIQLRSPSGSTAWQGEWGPDSDLWTSSIRQEMTGKCDTGAEQGCFWMGWNDFIGRFKGLYMCRCHADWERAAGSTRVQLSPPETRHDFKFALDDEGKDWQADDMDALDSAKKHQVGRSSSGVAYFHVKVPPGGMRANRKSLLCVSQRDIRSSHHLAGYAALEFRVLGGTNQQLEERGHTLIGRSKCCVGKDAWLECELETGAEYIIVAEVADVSNAEEEDLDPLHHEGEDSIELSASCWRETKNTHAVSESEEEDGDAWWPGSEAGGQGGELPADVWMSRGGNAEELESNLWGAGSDVTVVALSADDAWATLSTWYSQRIATSIGDGQSYDLGKNADTVGLPYWTEWSCEAEKVVALRYVNRSGSVVIREHLRWGLGGMRVVAASGDLTPRPGGRPRTPGQETGPVSSFDVVVAPGETALLVVHGAVLGVPTACEYERAVTLDFVETST